MLKSRPSRNGSVPKSYSGTYNGIEICRYSWTNDQITSMEGYDVSYSKISAVPTPAFLLRATKNDSLDTFQQLAMQQRAN